VTLPLAVTTVARLDALITRERVRNYSLIFLVLGAAAVVLNVALGPYPMTAAREVAFPDFVAHWTGGRLLLDGRLESLYDPAVQVDLQRRELPASSGLFWFVSPPPAAFLYLPLAALPYAVSALLWTVLTAACLTAAVLLARRLMAGRARDYPVMAIVFVASPAALQLVDAGQDSGLALLIIMVGLRLLLSGRDALAGCVLALGLFKPQLFVLVPLALLAQQRFRAFGAFLLTAMSLCAASLMVLGADVWRSWWAAIGSPLYQSGVQVGQTWKMQSVSALLTALGTPPALAYGVLVMGAVVLVLRVRRIRSDTPQVWALTLLTTVVCSPHVMSYDLVILLPVLTYLASRPTRAAVRLLSVATVVLLASVALRLPLSQLDPGHWVLLAAPWSALPLLGLWVVLLRSGSSTEDTGRPVPEVVEGHAKAG
jgi:hypothetical protein